MDPDAADWFADDTPAEEATSATDDNIPQQSSAESVRPTPSIPAGPPVPNPYAHLLEVPSKKREYTHWARNKHLQYKYVTEYSQVYYNDYVDYMDKRLKGIKRDVPRPQEWAERALKLYTGKGVVPVSRSDVEYWYTTKNDVKPMYSIFHPVHAKDYYDRQYKSILC